jgi:hypothetical protein
MYLNNVTTCTSSLNVSGVTTFRNSTTNFLYNTLGTSFTNNGFSSFFTLNANVITNGGTSVRGDEDRFETRCLDIFNNYFALRAESRTETAWPPCRMYT